MTPDLSYKKIIPGKREGKRKGGDNKNGMVIQKKCVRVYIVSELAEDEYGFDIIAPVCAAG